MEADNLFNIVRWFCSHWEIPDNLPSNGKTSVVVAMALSPLSNGELGAHAEKILRTSAEWVKEKRARRMLLSNRLPVGRNGETLAEVGLTFAIRCGVAWSQITIPNRISNSWVRNTRREAEFAITWVDEFDSTERKSILIVANSTHMRRVIATFKEALGDYEYIDLYWMSVGSDCDYGQGFVQKRFLHPLFFLCYEVVAFSYSKLKGIA